MVPQEKNHTSVNALISLSVDRFDCPGCSTSYRAALLSRYGMIADYLDCTWQMSPSVFFNSPSVFPPLYYLPPALTSTRFCVTDERVAIPIELMNVNNSLSLLRVVFPQRKSLVAQGSTKFCKLQPFFAEAARAAVLLLPGPWFQRKLWFTAPLQNPLFPLSSCTLGEASQSHWYSQH